MNGGTSKGSAPNLTLSNDIALQALAYMLLLGLVTGLAPAISALKLNIVTAFSRR